MTYRQVYYDADWKRLDCTSCGLNVDTLTDGLCPVCVQTAVGQLIEVARSNPECFKCGEPIADLSDVRIVTVRVDGKPRNVWVHAAHAQPTPAR